MATKIWGPTFVAETKLEAEIMLAVILARPECDNYDYIAKYTFVDGMPLSEVQLANINTTPILIQVHTTFEVEALQEIYNKVNKQLKASKK